MLTKPHPSLAPLEAVRVLAVGLRQGEVRALREKVADRPGLRISGARSLSEAVAFVSAGDFDVILADVDVWESDLGGVRSTVEKRHGDLGVILVGDAEAPLGDDTLGRLGAHDWLARAGAEPAAVAEAISSAWTDSRSARRRHTMVRWLEREARTDYVTGLYNRRAFEEELDRACGASRRQGTPVTLLMIDVTGMDAVVDAYGREHGDRMIARAASAVARCIRAHDFAARIGTDDFGVILANGDLDLGRRVARRISQEIERMNNEVWADDIPVSVGFGVASGIACTASALFEAAEVQLRRHKIAARPLPLFHERVHDDGPSVA
jgi:diguanylate cyclase (GGDEF)-like protein